MKSSFSESRGMCVDVAPSSSDCLNSEKCAVHVTDTKAGRRSPILHFTREEWAAFVAGVKDDEFDIDRLRA